MATAKKLGSDQAMPKTAQLELRIRVRETLSLRRSVEGSGAMRLEIKLNDAGITKPGLGMRDMPLCLAGD